MYHILLYQYYIKTKLNAFLFQLYIYFNGYDVHGSPHVFRVGPRSKKPRDSASPSPAYARISSPGNIIIYINRFYKEILLNEFFHPR